MYDISYADMPRHLADDKAVDDLKRFVGNKTFAILREEADKVANAKDWNSINHSLGFIGICGYPVHAFGRRYCLTGYREWMHGGDDPVETDAQGFQV